MNRRKGRKQEAQARAAKLAREAATATPRRKAVLRRAIKKLDAIAR